MQARGGRDAALQSDLVATEGVTGAGGWARQLVAHAVRQADGGDASRLGAHDVAGNARLHARLQRTYNRSGRRYRGKLNEKHSLWSLRTGVSGRSAKIIFSEKSVTKKQVLISGLPQALTHVHRAVTPTDTDSSRSTSTIN